MKVLYIVRPNLFTVPGGDTIQVQNTAKYLGNLGVDIDIKIASETIIYKHYQLIHFFNIIRPSDMLYHIKKSQLPYVVSTIFVDYSEYENKKSSPIRKLIYRFFGTDGLEYLKKIARMLFNNDPIVSKEYLFKGHKNSIKKILKGAQILLPNSENEYKRLEKKYCVSKSYKIIPNAIDINLFNSDTNNKQRKGIICVARIEGLKNQLNLIKAVGEKYPLKIIGKCAPNHNAYFELCKQSAGKNVEFINHISQAELKEHYKSAKVHVLASWFETTGLSSLEAAYMGCNIVITDKGDQKEYFKDYAFYCNPDSISSIAKAIDIAYEMPFNEEIKKNIKNNYIWEITANKTLEAYKTALKK